VSQTSSEIEKSRKTGNDGQLAMMVPFPLPKENTPALVWYNATEGGMKHVCYGKYFRLVLRLPSLTQFMALFLLGQW
jgi:hypothetical protein